MNLNRSKRLSALIALYLSVFIIGTAELLPMGLLLPLAQDLHIGLSLTGMLVTGYALGVAIGGPPIFVLTGRLPRKTLLCLFLLVFTIGGAICTFATTFWMLLLGRIISSFAHGIFFGMAVLTAKDLATAEKGGTYISIVMMGITLSVIFGAPAGAFIGIQLGWRAAFLVITLLSVLTLILLFVGLPDLSRLEKVSLKDQLMKLGNGQFIAAFLATTFCIGGFFAGFTYISPLLEKITGFSAHSISIILFIFGIGAIVGNLIGGKQADKNLRRAIFTGTSLLILSLIMLFVVNHMKLASVIAIFILGVASYGIMTPFQLLMLQKSAGAEELAATINISAFNLGNAIGPLIGSLTLICGWGLKIIPLTGAITVFVGLLLSVWCQAKEGSKQKNV
ncbi:MFS transporter [Sporolactobacillus sp. CPB3-1]|uniref:MFS transporter n=1 Tax=Sporolactobacillus mangiferae TaxID=2940498 RepID=A0ABT0MBD5_9BACL|nr:MFS transporter [Sporolactobacillus mangiferae]MCL1631594.1 MFS transporter [Sporolactobacillus mangiferae]